MPDHQGDCPRARENDVMSERLGDELLLFDASTNRAHSLNATAATVWHACDGTRNREKIAEHCQLDPLAVELALDNLADANLLTDYTPPAQRVSRRTAIRRLALTGATLGIALPVIRTIVAPSAAMAASTATCSEQGGQCGGTHGAICCSGLYCKTGMCHAKGGGRSACSASAQCQSEFVCSTATHEGRIPAGQLCGGRSLSCAEGTSCYSSPAERAIYGYGYRCLPAG